MSCENKNECTCPNKDCKNHGKCCDCVKFHRDERASLPLCLRALKKKEDK